MVGMRLLHFGFKVHDIERTMQAYNELFGIDWDPVAEFALPRGDNNAQLSRTKVTHGKTGDGVEIELVQYVEGPPVDDMVMGEREGISHVAFLVDDLAAERAKAEAKGIAIVNEGTAPRASWIFLHDHRLGGALVQLVQLNK
ncbi:VOC family protein [Terricaulis silvestris]|uniref:Methylmalonyl-CoA epimerase n=1 Tax=Terricaulis silvestris TaxID=2686094 RepID=A0A6I6MLF4_9CAUL|nr:VOC family protein [Terricaulis silvestris]QGZ96225.1 methylmalonyl-CoA epimerase [Terricaulis silvestris]